MNNITVNMENLSTEEREQLMKLIEKANKVEDKVWKPKNREKYYFIACDGTTQRVTYSDSVEDKLIYSIGNCFRTKEEAEFAVEKLKVIAEMKRIASKDEIEWDGNNGHYHIYYAFSDGRVKMTECCSIKYSSIYFASEERAHEAVETIGEDRLKKYLFGVEV